MKSKKIILGLILLTFTMGASVTIGRSYHVPDINTVRIESIRTLKIKQNAIVVAENEPDLAESESKPAADKKNRASGSGEKITENSSKSSDDEKTKPLKPFVPSEEIAAEQAVDFPIDI